MDAAVYGAICPCGEERALSRRLLAEAVRREYGLTDLPAVARAPGGKPYFPDRPDIRFNLSHSRGAAVCALHALPVGVDVERVRPAPRRLAGGLEDAAFFRRWTAKEATVKRSGQGLAALLREFAPDRLCIVKEDFLPGWIVAVCPSAECAVRWVTVEEI